MLNTKLFNLHDIILIGAIVIIVHVLARPLFDTIGAKPASSADTGG